MASFSSNEGTEFFLSTSPLLTGSVKRQVPCHPIDDLEHDSERILDAPMCRICWGDEDESQGGTLLQPCKCKGTSRYAHVRCLEKWIQAVAERKGPGSAKQCDVCKSRYRLPKNMQARENSVQWARRHIKNTYLGVIRRHGPIGSVFQSFAVSAWFFSVLSGTYGAVVQCAAMPRLLMQAREDPSVLRDLVPRFIAAALLEPLMASNDLAFYAETMLMYGVGWTIDAISRSIESCATLHLPQFLHMAINKALCVPKAFGFALQACDLAIMSFFGGGAAGFLQGAAECASTPFRLLSLLAKGSAALFGGVSMLLRSGGRGPDAVANLLSRRQRE